MWVCLGVDSKWIEFYAEEPRLEDGHWLGSVSGFIDRGITDGSLSPGVKAEMVSCVMQENGRWLLKVKRKPTLADAVFEYLENAHPAVTLGMRCGSKYGEVSQSALKLYDAMLMEKSK